MPYPSAPRVVGSEHRARMDRRLQDRMTALGWGGVVSGMPDAEYSLVLRATDGTQELLVGGTTVHAGASEEALRAASAWRERWYRLWKRSQLPVKLIAFFD